MYFVISCVDKPGQPGLRQDNRPDHLDYLGSHAERIVAAGPTLGDDDAPNGSVLVMDSRLWHATAPNLTETDRVALAVRYAPWWLNTEILRPGSDTRRQLVDEPGRSDNLVPSLPRQVYDSLSTNVQPLYRHWIEP